jgi:hypothetical protein
MIVTLHHNIVNYMKIKYKNYNIFDNNLITFKGVANCFILYNYYKDKDCFDEGLRELQDLPEDMKLLMDPNIKIPKWMSKSYMLIIRILLI